MRKLLTTLLISPLVSCVFLSSCEEDDNKNGHSVSGYVFDASGPVTAAEVSLDQMIQYTTTTDSEGYFQINNVPSGNYSLTSMLKSPDGAFSQVSEDINVNNTDVFIETFKLPKPVKLRIHNVVSNLESNDIVLSWNNYTGDDFREYKLYQHLTSGLDETTGTLTHVATFTNDTTFELSQDYNSTQYFRVFVMDEFGLLAGSNVLKVEMEGVANDPHLLTDQQYKLFKNRNTIEEFYFEAIENRFYAIAWEDYDWNDDSGQGYTIGTVLEVKCLESDEVTPYFEYTRSDQFAGTPHPIKAKSTGRIYLQVRARNGNETAQGSFGLKIYELNSPALIPAEGSVTSIILRNQPKIFYFDYAGSVINLSATALRTYWWYPGSREYNCWMGISVFSSSNSSPLQYKQLAPCCMEPPYQYTINVAPSGERFYVIVGGGVTGISNEINFSLQN